MADIDDLLGSEPGEAEQPAAKPRAKTKAAPAATKPAEPEIEGDTAREAHLRRQANWEEDAKEIFRGPSEDERRKAKILADLAEIDAKNKAEQRKLDEEKRRREEKETAAEKAAGLRERAAALKDEIKTIEAEATRLEKLAKE